jgi:hypothetical protein
VNYYAAVHVLNSVGTHCRWPHRQRAVVLDRVVIGSRQAEQVSTLSGVLEISSTVGSGAENSAVARPLN